MADCVCLSLSFSVSLTPFLCLDHSPFRSRMLKKERDRDREKSEQEKYCQIQKENTNLEACGRPRREGGSEKALGIMSFLESVNQICKFLGE